jgi:hypothetical protein
MTGNPICDGSTGLQSSAQCTKWTYNGFGPGIFVKLALNFNKDATTIINNNLLTGAQYTAVDASVDAQGNVVPGFVTTVDFGDVVNGVFTADSRFPDFTKPNLLLNASTFQNASAVKLGKKLAQCTPPYTTIVSKNGKTQTIVCPDGNISGGPD